MGLGMDRINISKKKKKKEKRKKKKITTTSQTLTDLLTQV